MSRALACVYGALLDEPQPLAGLWIVWKHTATGELVGPTIPDDSNALGRLAGRGFYTPVYAELDRDGWHEIDTAEAHRRKAAI